VPFFFKQWGGVMSKSGGRTLDGKLWSQFPRPNDKKFEKPPLPR